MIVIAHRLRTEKLPTYRAFCSVSCLLRTITSVHHQDEDDDHQSCESLWATVVAGTMAFIDNTP
jgi:hypothetical protein